MNLKELIKLKDMNQKIIAYEISRKLRFKKYQQQVSEWCNGVRLPDLLCTYYLAEILNEPLDVVIKACLKSVGAL